MGTDEPVRGAEFWDERYRSAPNIWSGNPNPQLIAEVAQLEPGKALDVGAGEGADAIWLAEHGWNVVATDISQIALDRGRAQAESRGEDVADRITWTQADLLQEPPAPQIFDLVSVHFMHMPSEQRNPLYAKLADSVRSGGTLLIVGHHPSDLATNVRRPPLPDFLFTQDELAENLGDGWSFEVCEARPRPGTDPDGNEVTVHDTVLKARRR